MEPYNQNIPRHQIIHTFAEWCAFSATRSGCPLKSRAVVYPLICTPDYTQILNGDQFIDETAFDKWHKKSCEAIDAKSQIGIGWAAKLINVYLKAICYTGMIGRPGLITCLHPPIDNGLIEGIRDEFINDKTILEGFQSFKSIKEINDYQKYFDIIKEMRLVCMMRNWKLIEIEVLWKGTNFKTLIESQNNFA
jgi:hypothetical protein